MELTGSIDGGNWCAAYIDLDGLIRIRGNVKTKAKQSYALIVNSDGMISVDGSVDAPYPAHSRSNIGNVCINDHNTNSAFTR